MVRGEPPCAARGADKVACLALIVIQKVILAFLGVYLRLQVFYTMVVNVYLNITLTGER